MRGDSCESVCQHVTAFRPRIDKSVLIPSFVSMQNAFGLPSRPSQASHNFVDCVADDELTAISEYGNRELQIVKPSSFFVLTSNRYICAAKLTSNGVINAHVRS